MRYIDDLLTLNNSGFASKIPDIYPPELDLKKTTESSSTVSYLDILIIESVVIESVDSISRDERDFH